MLRNSTLGWGFDTLLVLVDDRDMMMFAAQGRKTLFEYRSRTSLLGSNRKVGPEDMSCTSEDSLS